MDFEKLISALERFFLDIIGTVAPGSALLIGLWATFALPALGNLQLAPPTTSAAWVLFLLASYLAGHALASIGSGFVAPVASRLAGGIRLLPLFKHLVPKSMVKESDLLTDIATRQSFKSVAAWVRTASSEPGDSAEWSVRPLRNVAMTVAVDEKPTVLRLMFLSLLNLGVATTLWTLGMAIAASRIVEAVRMFTSTRDLGPAAVIGLKGIGVLLLLMIVSVPFLERRFQFYSSSMHLPFDAALARIRQLQAPKTPQSQMASRESGANFRDAPAVYLAGGLHSGWQARVRDAEPSLRYRDPQSHGLTDTSAFTAWDLEAIKASNWVFGYIEATNPGGYALALELGYAKALGKHVILVDERSTADTEFHRHFRMPRAIADVNLASLDEGIRYLSAQARNARTV